MQRREVTVDGVARSYRLFTPPSLDHRRPAPLVVALHGGGNTAESLVGTTMLDQVATANGFVVAYPEGLNRGWDAGFCCTPRRQQRVDEVAFLARVIDHVAANRRIDTGRVYAVGVSNGAMMAYRLGCQLADRIAGVGSVAGAMLLDECRPARPLSVIEIHGTEDRLVPYAGGQVGPAGVASRPVPPTRAVVERWASLNRCSAPPVVEVSGVVRTETWSECGDGTRVRLVTVEGGQHSWFASEFGPVNGAVDATGALVEFFGLHTKG